MATLQADHPIFKDPTKLTRWVTWLLYAGAVLATVAVISDLMELVSLMQIGRDIADPDVQVTAASDANDTRQGVIALVQLAWFVVIGMLILRWIYRANANIRALGATSLVNTPGWAIGWYFIPIANLWKPYQALKEIWRATADPVSPSMVERTRLLPWWWALWLLSGFFGQVVFRLTVADNDLEGLLAANGATVASDLLDIPLNIVFVVLVGQIYRMQMQHARAWPAQPEQVPPTPRT